MEAKGVSETESRTYQLQASHFKRLQY